MQIKTIMLWWQPNAINEFAAYSFDGDLRRFNGIYINSTSEGDLVDELCELMFGKDYVKNPIEPAILHKDKMAKLPWAYTGPFILIHCGVIA